MFCASFVIKTAFINHQNCCCCCTRKRWSEGRRLPARHHNCFFFSNEDYDDSDTALCAAACACWQQQPVLVCWQCIPLDWPNGKVRAVVPEGRGFDLEGEMYFNENLTLRGWLSWNGGSWLKFDFKLEARCNSSTTSTSLLLCCCGSLIQMPWRNCGYWTSSEMGSRVKSGASSVSILAKAETILSHAIWAVVIWKYNDKVSLISIDFQMPNIVFISIFSSSGT